jgi:hypothetical protein
MVVVSVGKPEGRRTDAAIKDANKIAHNRRMAKISTGRENAGKMNWGY